jgi:serine/threonine-protein kinase
MNDARRNGIPVSPDDTVEFLAPITNRPTSIGAFTLVRSLGIGNHFTIYEARSSTSPDERLVVKIGRGDSQRVRNVFASMASVMNVLDHPNILPCKAFGATAEHCYIAMPWIEGGDLQQTVMNAGTLEPAWLLRIIAATAQALDYAHGRGIVHGDLHPKHILLDHDDHPWLIGFGEVSSRGRGDIPFGNPHHRAPEQLESNATVPATDIYALAEVSYLCLCGCFPFANSDGILKMLERKRSGPIPSIRERRPDLSKRLDRVLQRGMAIHPDERYPSAGEFAKALATAIKSKTKRRWWRIW